MAGDTDFRRVFDREAAAQRSKDGERKRREEGEARAAAEAQGKKWHGRARTPTGFEEELTARAQRLDVQSMIGKTQLIANIGNSKRGQSAGFWCSHCDLTYKDNIQFLEHLNSKQHMSNAGISDEVKRATHAQVRERLRYLCYLRREASKDQVVNLDARLELSRENEEKEREEKRRKRNEKRRKTPGGIGHIHVKMENDGIIS